MSSKSSYFSKKTLLAVIGLALVLGILTVGRSTFSSSLSSLLPFATDTQMDMAVSETSIMAEPLGMQRDGLSLPYPQPYFPGDALEHEERFYHHSANFSLVVSDVSSYLQSTREYILSQGGRVLSSSQDVSSKQESGYLYAKVPVSSFEAVTAQVTQGVSRVMREHVSSNDQTGLIVNTADRVQLLEEQKIEKEIELLEAVSEAQRKRIELQITQLERQILNARNSQESAQETVEYASISVSVANTPRYFDPSIRLSPLDELRQAVNSAKDVAILLGYVLIWTGVYALLFLPIVLIFAILRRRKNNQAHLESEVEA